MQSAEEVAGVRSAVRGQGVQGSRGDLPQPVASAPVPDVRWTSDIRHSRGTRGGDKATKRRRTRGARRKAGTWGQTPSTGRRMSHVEARVSKETPCVPLLCQQWHCLACRPDGSRAVAHTKHRVPTAERRPGRAARGQPGRLPPLSLVFCPLSLRPAGGTSSCKDEPATGQLRCARGRRQTRRRRGRAGRGPTRRAHLHGQLPPRRHRSHHRVVTSLTGRSPELPRRLELWARDRARVVPLPTGPARPAPTTFVSRTLGSLLYIASQGRRVTRLVRPGQTPARIALGSGPVNIWQRTARFIKNHRTVDTGGGGNRTPVPVHFGLSFYVRSRSFRV